MSTETETKKAILTADDEDKIHQAFKDLISTLENSGEFPEKDDALKEINQTYESTYMSWTFENPCAIEGAHIYLRQHRIESEIKETYTAGGIGFKCLKIAHDKVEEAICALGFERECFGEVPIIPDIEKLYPPSE